MTDDMWGEGEYLVVITKNCKSTTPIKSDFPELEAAMYYAKEAMVNAMHEKDKMRPRKVRMSPKEIKAWEAYKEIMGSDHPAYFEFASLNEIAEAGCQAVMERAEKNKRKRLKNEERNKEQKASNSIFSLEP